MKEIMTTSTPAHLVEEAIRTFLARGFELSGEVRHFLEATFGDAALETVKRVIDDPGSAERDSLLDLIFFPDIALQVAIEPLLGADCLTDTDIVRLGARLKTVPAAARLQIPAAAAAVPLVMPAFTVEAFLTRLHLTWQPVSALAKAIEQHDFRSLSPASDHQDGRLRLRVRLRNANLSQTPVQVDFLCDFLERRPADGAAFVDQLDFILVFLQEHDAARNLYQALMARKAFLLRHLQKTRRAAHFAARNNPETLIMTGVRRPYFDMSAAQRSLAQIDAVAMAVFGRTEWMEGAPREIDLGGHHEGLDPAEVIRRLS